MTHSSNALTDLSNALAAAVETVGKSTVTVKARRRIPATGLIWSDDGLIVTANHVVDRDENIMVVLPDGSELEAELVGRDPSSDIAALRIATDQELTAATKSAAEARPGHIVLALGRPHGKTPQVALGAVSQSGSTLRTRRGGQVEGAIRADVTMYPGFSGGPLVDASGQVIGLNTSGLSRGLPVTVPHAEIDRIVGILIERGRIARGYLGVSLQRVRIPASLRDQLPNEQENGLLIVGVEPDSPAENGGLLLGDTIYTFGGEGVRDPRQVHEQLGPGSVGVEFAIQLLRAGEVVDTTITPGER